MFRVLFLFLFLSPGCTINSRQLSTNIVVDDTELIPFEPAIKFIKSLPSSSYSRSYSAVWHKEYGIFSGDKYDDSPGFENIKKFYSELALIAEIYESNIGFMSVKHCVISVFNKSDITSSKLYTEENLLNYGIAVYFWTVQKKNISDADFRKLISAYVSLGIKQVKVNEIK